ncbi:hypothetical protein [Mycolicibacterium rhodesiae]|uniref:hypothetical protein n=1 Tax=Mycolicibacterium rhodesiae TaxID=36814 RepID=UPI00022E6137|nr:hypothetical protein [Mycolicibacterium rhodesiae]
MAADVRLMSGGIIGLTEVAVGVPAALQRGWIDAVLPADGLLSQAIATARALGAHSPFAYAVTKDQLHLPTRDRRGKRHRPAAACGVAVG